MGANASGLQLVSRGVLAAAMMAGVLLASRVDAAASSSKPATAAKPATPHPSFAGYWRFQGYKSHLTPIEQRILRDDTGEVPPLLPWAKKIYDERIDLQRHGQAWADSQSYCLPAGMPRVMFGSGYPMQIVQQADMLMIIFEPINEFRYVFIDKPLQVDYPTWRGESVARWDGDALVVHTAGMNDRTTLDKVGMPHSEDIESDERIRLLDRDTLEIQVTVTDPKTFSRPWTKRTTYKRMAEQRGIAEFVCLENQRHAPDANGLSDLQLPTVGGEAAPAGK